MNLFRYNSALPDFLEDQRNSFRRFIQFGIREELDFASPIVTRWLDTTQLPPPGTRSMSLSFLSKDFYFRKPKYTPQRAVQEVQTYNSQLIVPVRFSYPSLAIDKILPITFCSLPLMTEYGTFVINGSPRIIVHQIVRSPGVYMKAQFDVRHRRTHLISFLSAYGSWLRFESDLTHRLWVRLDNFKKIPITIFLQALGFSFEDIISIVSRPNALGPTILEVHNGNTRKLTDLNTLAARAARANWDKKRKKYKVPVMPLWSKRTRITLHTKPLYIAPPLAHEIREKHSQERDLQNTDSHAAKTPRALRNFLYSLYPSEIPTVQRAKKFLFKHLFNPSRYSFSEIGRKQVNRKLRMLRSSGHLTLTPEDALAALDFMIRLEFGESRFLDDIDHLKNRRARLSGDLIQTQFRLGLNRLDREIHSRIDDQMLLPVNDFQVPLFTFIRTQVVASSFQEFFSSSQLSQFMDQTNPLAELTHKRRLSSLGPGGLHRDRAGLVVRGIHPSYYGRICPIETPEGKNAGLVGSIAMYARINTDGFLETPYYHLSPETKSPEYDRFYLLTPFYEDSYVLASTDAILTQEYVSVRAEHKFTERLATEINYIGLCPIQFMSIATSLIPFLEHDDANRALMGSNMQRQAVSLLKSERAFVGTGLEGRMIHDSGAILVAPQSGYVVYVDGQRIKYLIQNSLENNNASDLRYETVWFKTYHRSNQDTCIHQRPSAQSGTWFEAGDCLADNTSTFGGELALGKNIFVGYMPWEGYNFEDAVLISERLVFDDIFTSVHIERYEIETSRTREGQEYITKRVERNSRLDEFGIIPVGLWVESGDVLVGRIAPQQESETTAETRLLRAIFGLAVTRQVRDTALTVPTGVTGRILERRSIFTHQTFNKDFNVFESIGRVYIYLVQKRKIQIGDKISGRHGNKGIISNIIPRQDMPFVQNGRPLDMVLNPLGVPSRMNVGQIFECLLGLAAHTLKQNFKVLPFDEMHGLNISRGFVYHKLYQARLCTQQKWLFSPDSPGKSIVFDGRSGEAFEQPVTVGYPYILKLVHLVDDKIHARSIGPYSLVTQQPLGGRSKHGGQRLGEMEVWALEGFGAAYTLQELLTIKSDDMQGRNEAFHALIRGQSVPIPRLPESFKVLISELRALCLDMSLNYSHG